MRGSFLHNHVLLDPLEAHFRGMGAQCWREFPTCQGRGAGFVDLFVAYQTDRIAIEAELSVDRVEKDVTKAVAVQADLLVIVTPTSRLAKAARRRLSRPDAFKHGTDMEIWCLPLGLALQRLMKKCHLMTARECPTRHEVIKSGES